MAAAFGGGHLGEWAMLPGLRDAVPPAAGGAEPPPEEVDTITPAPGGSTSEPTGEEPSTAASAAVAPPATGGQPAAPPAELPSTAVSRQQVSVSLLPGPVHIDVTAETLSIADARGSVYGWELSLGNAAVGPLMGVQPESAAGVAASGARIAKDLTTGSYGSTGGTWVWRLDQADLAQGVTVTFRAPDCRTVTHTYPPAGGELHVAVA